MQEAEPSLLLSLAPELIQAITDELTIDAVKDLRLTCKQLGEFLNPRLFRELTISFSRATYENDLSKVRILATKDCHAASSGTRTLKITSLSPAYDPGYRGAEWKNVDGEWIQEPDPETPLEAMLAEKELKGYLFKAIASLKGVQSVEWRPLHKDGDWAQKDVMDALKILPNLRVLLLHATDCSFPFPLHDLSGIQEISIHGRSEKCNAEIVDNVAKLVARSPKITSIDINSYSSCYAADKSQSLHQIFKHYPQNSSPLRLRHLSLRACLVKLDDVTLPHLQHLTSLSLMNIEDPYNRIMRWGADSSNLQLSKEQQTYGSSIDDIWKALKNSRIFLEELALNVVVPSLLEYLASYSGLKKLRLTAGGFLDGISSDSMARQFFSTPFINHVQSLEDLRISALFEGFWCFGPWNQAIVSRCTNLKTFGMAIVSGQLYPLPGSPSDKIDEVGVESNVIGLLINTVSNSMPKLESLFISAADLEMLRMARCGNPSMHHFARTARDILLSVNMYRAPPTCHRLPRLTACNDSGRTFIPIGPDEDGPLRYLDTSPPSQDGDHSSLHFYSFF